MSVVALERPAAAEDWMAGDYVEVPIGPVDSPGADVGERMRSIHITLHMAYHVPNPKVRRRGARVYPREDLLVHRRLRVNLNHTHLDRQTGPRRIAESVAREIYRRLTLEGWPIRVRELDEERRPGA